jgi:hypothetical protein
MYEPMFFVGSLLWLFVIGVDEYLFQTVIERYMDVFGTDDNFQTPFYGYYMFWRLLDYDNRKF